MRNITEKDIPHIVNLQKASFADMAAYGMIWPKLNEYLYDERSLNYASFIEWLNPKYIHHYS